LLYKVFSFFWHFYFLEYFMSSGLEKQMLAWIESEMYKGGHPDKVYTDTQTFSGLHKWLLTNGLTGLLHKLGIKSARKENHIS
jgi:hypothetical protein